MHDAREHFYLMFFATLALFPRWDRTGCLKQWELDKGRERKTILWSTNRKFQTPPPPPSSPTLIPGLTLIPVLNPPPPPPPLRTDPYSGLTLIPGSTLGRFERPSSSACALLALCGQFEQFRSTYSSLHDAQSAAQTCFGLRSERKNHQYQVDLPNTSLKGFYWPKARRKDVQKSSDISVYNTINREEVLTSSLLMVLYTEISELFCTSFRLAFGQ